MDTESETTALAYNPTKDRLYSASSGYTIVGFQRRLFVEYFQVSTEAVLFDEEYYMGSTFPQTYLDVNSLDYQNYGGSNTVLGGCLSLFELIEQYGTFNFASHSGFYGFYSSHTTQILFT